MKLRISRLLAITASALPPGQSRAADLTTLYSFCANIGCTDGMDPNGSLITDANGNLLGTTSFGGAYSWGTVFEIAKTAAGYASTPTALVSFFCDFSSTCLPGGAPEAGVIADADGNLFGTNSYNGIFEGGTVFEIAKTTAGYASTPTLILNFGQGAFNKKGRVPNGLVADANGNLFGTTSFGGANVGNLNLGQGTVFEIAKTAGGYVPITNLVNFCSLPNCADGAGPSGALIVDADGNLFGTAGNVFEIVKTADGYASTATPLVNSNNFNGGFPAGGLVADADGNLFGTTSGGGAYGCGTVFEIAKTADGYASTPTMLTNFNCADGAGPSGPLIVDAIGNLFGTTTEGGSNECTVGVEVEGCGTVFEIAKTPSGYASTPTILFNFNGTNGSSPQAGLLADADGNLLGTTSRGGANGAGTVFEITGSGFIPRGLLAGTPGKANCYGQSVSALTRKYRGLNAAAAALGYSSAKALQNTILAFCEG